MTANTTALFLVVVVVVGAIEAMVGKPGNDKAGRMVTSQLSMVGVDNTIMMGIQGLASPACDVAIEYST